ncbi:MAG: regulatory protein marr [Frankiales bacterium]|nr:regulatory protein marr [Frankiales bacterium]
MTRWLDEDEQRAWRALLSAIEALQTGVDAQLQAEAGMPHTYYELLVRLSEAPDRSRRMSALADAAGSSRSRLSHAVGQLERRGWIRRETCPTDRRGQIAVLTDDGYAALEQAAPGHVEQVRRLVFDRLTAVQVQQLRRIGEAVAATPG